MNQLTTIAGLPSASGCMSAVAPEVGKLRAPFSGFCRGCETCAECLKNGCIPEVADIDRLYIRRDKFGTPMEMGFFPILEPDLLETSKPEWRIHTLNKDLAYRAACADGYTVDRHREGGWTIAGPEEMK